MVEASQNGSRINIHGSVIVPSPTHRTIPLPRGRQLVTLEEAANYIQKLPEAEQLLEEWQAAVEALLMVV
jgi:hypothetical protein